MVIHLSPSRHTTPMGEVECTVIDNIDEPKQITELRFLPEGETATIAAGTSCVIKSQGTWKQAYFLDEGALTGPLVYSAEPIESMDDVLWASFRATNLGENFALIVFTILGLPVLATMLNLGASLSAGEGIAGVLLPQSLVLIGVMTFFSLMITFLSRRPLMAYFLKGDHAIRYIRRHAQGRCSIPLHRDEYGLVGHSGAGGSASPQHAGAALPAL